MFFYYFCSSNCAAMKKTTLLLFLLLVVLPLSSENIDTINYQVSMLFKQERYSECYNLAKDFILCRLRHRTQY